MPKLLRLAVPLTLLLAPPALAEKRSEPRAVGSFQAIEVGGGISLVTQVGATRAVEVTTESDDVSEVLTEVKGDTLAIHWRSHPGFNVHHGATVRVTAPALSRVEASGGSRAEVAALSGDRVEAQASGGAHLSVDAVAAKQLEATASGGSRVTLKGGPVERGEVSASGGGRVSAPGLTLHEARVEASGGAAVEVGVDQRLDAAASGGGHVRIHGRPQVLSQEASHGSEVTFE